jgi:hypothetical protein
MVVHVGNHDNSDGRGINRLEGNLSEAVEMTEPYENVSRQIAIAAFVSVLLVAPTMWMLMDRAPPYTFESVEIVPHDAVQGEDIQIHFTIKQDRPACGVGTIYREYREASGKLQLYEPIKRDAVADPNNNQFTRIETLPDSISLGPTIYRQTACYICNPIHSLLRWPVCVSTPNVHFNVVGKPS